MTQEHATPSSTPPQQEKSNGELDVSLMDILLVLAKRKGLLVGLPIMMGVVALGISFLIKPEYTASTQLIPPQQQQSSAMAALLGSAGGMASALGSIAGIKNPADQWVGLLKSRAVADSIVSRFKLREVYESEFLFQARDQLASKSRIIAGKDGLIRIEVDDQSPERAAEMATAYIDELQNMMKTLAVTEAAQRRLFFEKQLNESKENLIKAETALKEGGISASVLKTSPEMAVGRVAQAQAAVAAQEVKVSVMRGTFTDNNPEFRKELLELSSMREQLRNAEKSEPQNTGGSGTEYIARYREFKYFETLFELFARQYEMARADEAREGTVIQVVDPALVPEYKSKPKRGLLAVMATIFTFLLTTAYVLIQHSISKFAEEPEGKNKIASLRLALRLRRS